MTNVEIRKKPEVRTAKHLPPPAHLVSTFGFPSAFGIWFSDFRTGAAAGSCTQTSSVGGGILLLNHSRMPNRSGRRKGTRFKRVSLVTSAAKGKLEVQ